MATILDLHCHSVFSDDARATVEQYLRWVSNVVRKDHRLDGIVLTEHRGYDEADYAEIAARYGVLVLKACELDTDSGHFLVYGVNDHLRGRFDFRDVRLSAEVLVREAEASGAVAIPAHPGRERIGFIEHMGQGDFSGIRTVEVLNGGSRDWENERAAELVRARGYSGIGGSDAHFVNMIGRCITRFEADIRSGEDLVAALRGGAFTALPIEEVEGYAPAEEAGAVDA